MNPEIEKLRQEKVKNERELEQCKHQEQRLKNRITYYTEGERKKRNHRLITRGAAIESIVPSVKEMDEAEFYALAERIFSLPAVMEIISGGDGV